MARDEIERRWRQRLQDAQSRLDFAVAYLREVEQDRGAGRIPIASAADAFEHAVEAENLARADHLRLLVIYYELVKDGKIPAEEEERSYGASGG